MEVVVKAPAKINLSLDVLGKRPDGYHNVYLTLQTVTLYDTITISSTDTKDITIECETEGVPLDKTNIVYKAAQKFFHYTNEENTGIHIKIDKVIPSQAGLAGGSSDGAATVMGLNNLFSTGLTDKEMEEICQKVGSDVPFFIKGGTQLGKDTGTTLERLTHMPDCHIVICKPPIGISTKEAYDAIDSAPQKQFKFTDELIKALYQRDYFLVSSSFYNDFEAVLDVPEVRELHSLMLKNKASGACMSGSGSAVFGMFRNEKKANKCAEKLKESYKDVFVCKPLRGGVFVV